MPQNLIHFHTFGDGSLGIKMAANRLARQAKEFGLFTSIHVWDLEKLVNVRPDFEIHKTYIQNNHQGLGNWIWKPHILDLALAECEENDIVVFLDAGCQLNINKESLSRLSEYLQILDQYGTLFMQLKPGDFGILDLTERAWTKWDARKKLDPNDEFSDTYQIQSGIILVKNSHKTRALAKEWAALCEYEDYRYLRSPVDSSQEEAAYLGHRWEQSILSLLAKRNHFNCIPDETYFAPDWTTGLRYPIWATRNRSGGDCIRRNFFDKFLILLAKFEREILQTFRWYRIFLTRRIINSMAGK